jgi:hypothetical protein
MDLIKKSLALSTGSSLWSFDTRLRHNETRPYEHSSGSPGFGTWEYYQSAPDRKIIEHKRDRPFGKVSR